MRRFALVAMALAVAPLGWSNQRVQGFCEQGGKAIVTSGLSSTTKAQASYPACLVTVYLTGTMT